MRYKLFACIQVLFVLSAASAFGNQPPWVMLEKGRVAYEERNLALALDILSDTIEADPEYPEAEYWLGRVYESQGQLVLAEEQYRRALSLSLYLRVPEDKVLYEYSLAGLLLNRGGGSELEAESILLGLLSLEEGSTASKVGKDHMYIKIITEIGMDELLFLYRDELTYSLEARRILGEIAWKDARYRTSLLHSTRTVLSLLTTASEYLRDKDSDWRFDIDPVDDAKQPDRDVRYPAASDGVEALLHELSFNYPDTYDWLAVSGFWSQLYLLAVSAYAEGYPQTAESVWKILTVEDTLDGTFTGKAAAGRWGRLAARQLDEPFISTGSMAP